MGIPSSLNTIQINLTVLILTGLVGRFGPISLAGYGAASRLEFLLTPLVFGLGSAMVPLVATCVGAGDIARARRVAWLGAALASTTTASIGLIAAVCPWLWMDLFSDDANVVAAGSAYLRRSGPAYGAIGLGLSLYFAVAGNRPGGRSLVRRIDSPRPRRSGGFARHQGPGRRPGGGLCRDGGIPSGIRTRHGSRRAPRAAAPRL